MSALHEPLVDRLAEGLDEEEIAAADRDVESGVDLAGREGAVLGRHDLGAERGRDIGDQLRVRAPAGDDETLLGLGDEAGGDAVVTVQIDRLLLARHRVRLLRHSGSGCGVCRTRACPVLLDPPLDVALRGDAHGQ